MGEGGGAVQGITSEGCTNFCMCHLLVSCSFGIMGLFFDITRFFSSFFGFFHHVFYLGGGGQTFDLHCICVVSCCNVCTS